MKVKKLLVCLFTICLLLTANNVLADGDGTVPALCPPQVSLDLPPGFSFLQVDACFTLPLPEHVSEYAPDEDNYEACSNYLNCFGAADTIYIECVDSGNGAGCQPLADMNLIQCEMHLELCLA